MRSPARTCVVPEGLAGAMLDQAVRTLFGLSWGRARALIDRGKVRVDDELATVHTTPVRAGASLVLDPAARAPRGAALGREAIVHLDAHVVVVRKPAGVSTVPFDEREHGTLDELVRAHLASTASSRRERPNLGVVHRLDRETTGLVVFTRTWLAKKSLSAQFRDHSVTRRYFAIVHGILTRPATYRSHIMEDRGDGLRGSWEARPRKGPPAGQHAVTHVEPVEPLAGATLVACRLETGRTHQIRVHLSEAGHPLVGERVYVRGRAVREIPAPRLMLHATTLGFVHPKTEEAMIFEEPIPRDMREVIAALARGP